MRRTVLILGISTLLVVSSLIFDVGTHAQAAPADTLRAYPVVPAIRGAVANKIRALRRTNKRLGGRGQVFSKVGDSISDWGYYLTPVGAGGLRLEKYPRLATAVSFFTQQQARTNNSFANFSAAARGGWGARDALEPGRNFIQECGPGETPLDCEFRLTRPAVALIMFGTNDMARMDVNTFRADLDRLVATAERWGVIPVLSTIPYRKDEGGRFIESSLAFNLAIVSVAQTRAVPLWNYWLAIDGLGNNGVSSDQVHPSAPPDGNTAIFDDFHLQYGFTIRNLTAIQVLNALIPYLR